MIGKEEIMQDFSVSRRGLVLGAGAAAAIALTPVIRPVAAQVAAVQPETAEQQRRLAWWRAAKFGMFIHFGLYSGHARHEWAMESEAIPTPEYETYVELYRPTLASPHAWARLAKQTGMKYMVLTAKHHEGFCNWDTKLTQYNSKKMGPKIDVVRAYVEAARAEGLRVGLYYSLMDWHHPDGAHCATDEAARRRFVDYTHGLVRELLSNYGKIDILWYDMASPLDAKGWESERLNRMMFELQPDIIVNNRNDLPGDFSTPEQKIVAEAGARAWESCMTLNDSWGFQRADTNWKSSSTVVRNLISCAHDKGNYLLNIGPMGDGGIPPETARILTEVGHWMQANGDCIYQSDYCQPRRSTYASYTRTGNTLHMHVHFWPGGDVSIPGLQQKVLIAKVLKTGAPVKVIQDEFRTHLVGLPADAPDFPVTTISLECDGVPTLDVDNVREHRPRNGTV